jgi:hypothetical protein
MKAIALYPSLILRVHHTPCVKGIQSRHCLQSESCREVSGRQKKKKKKKSEEKLVSSELKSYAEPGSVPRAFSINRKLNHHETMQLGECVPVGENSKIFVVGHEEFALFISAVIIVSSVSLDPQADFIFFFHH